MVVVVVLESWWWWFDVRGNGRMWAGSLAPHRHRRGEQGASGWIPLGVRMACVLVMAHTLLVHVAQLGWHCYKLPLAWLHCALEV